jgi:C-terminal processing protease CtpA/Prc
MAAAGPDVLYGVTIERTEDDRYAVAELQFNGLAEQAGLELGDYVTEVDVEQVGQPAKQLVYPFGLALLGLVIASQLVRRRRALATA